MKIMAPAGDLERLNAAIKAGADEVYMGVAGFGARRFAKNFSVDEYCEAIDLAHRSNVSVHLTFNTVLSDAELNLVYPDIKRLYETGLDEVIVQDLGAAYWLRQNFPDLPLCASTQLSPGNAVELNWFEEQGFKRVVLARELSLEEMRAIRAKSKIEIEVFASGALCLGCSGKCYLSSFIGGRSGNRGMCAQPCRQYYKAQRLGNEDETTGEDYGYFLSLKDQLQGSREIAEMIKMGIDSIKIEGRMKSPSYVYEVVRYYRDLVDELNGTPRETAEKRLSVKGANSESADAKTSGKSSGAFGEVGARSNADSEKIARYVPLTSSAAAEEARRLDVAGVFNRGYAHGYYYERDPKIVNEYFASNFGVEVGLVRRDAIRLTQPLRNGDGVVFLDETARKLGGLNVSGIKLVDPTNTRRSRIVDRAQPNDLIRFDDPIPDGAATLYRTFNIRLNKEIDVALKQTRRREPIDAALVAKVGKPLELTLKNNRVSVTLRADQPVEAAQKRGADAETLLESIDRFGETPFYLRRFKPTFDPNAFVPKSALNQIRQAAAEELEKKTLESYRRAAPDRAPYVEAKPKRVWASDLQEKIDPIAAFAAVVRTQAQYDACKESGVTKIYRETQPVRFEGREKRNDDPQYAPIAGALGDAIELEREQKEFALDWTFNVGNARAVEYLAARFPHAASICLTPEISDRAVAALIANLDAKTPNRAYRLALPVYGRLLAMFTQKTLFEATRVRLINADDRRIIVEQNAAKQTAPENAVGSSLYLHEPLDLIDAIPWIIKTGIQELRFEFKTEKYAETREILKRARNVGDSGKYSTYSYGFTRDGVF